MSEQQPHAAELNPDWCSSQQPPANMEAARLRLGSSWAAASLFKKKRQIKLVITPESVFVVSCVDPVWWDDMIDVFQRLVSCFQ